MIELLRTYLRPYRVRIGFIASLVLVQAIGNLYLPTLNADIINSGVAKGDTGYIIRTGLIMLGITLLISLCSITSAFNVAKTAMGVGRDVRGNLYRKVESLSQSEMGRFGTPSLITRNTNDIQQVQMLLAIGLSMMLLAPMLAIGGIIMALRQDLPLSISIAVILPIMGVFLFLVLRRAIPLFRSMQARIDKINKIMRETLGGARVIRAFARTDHEEERFGTANHELTNVTVNVFRLFSVMIPTLIVIVNLSMVGIMWFGGHRVDSGGMPIGNLFAFIAYVMQIMFAVMMSVMMASQIPRAAASATRVQEVLSVEAAIHDPERPIPLPSRDGGRRGVVEFNDVEFSYPGALDPILGHISFTAQPGQTTAIVGSTGSGKSTLIGLIPRLNDVTDGSILIDGQDVRQMKRADLWSRIGFVPQKAFLFSGTVASNLRYGNPNATDDELWDALLSSLFGWLQGWIVAGVVGRVTYRLREEVDQKLARLPLKYFDGHARGDILSRVTNDIDNIQQTMQQTVTQIITSILTLVGVLALMFWISWLLALIALVSIPISVVVTMLTAKRSQKQFALQWEHTGTLSGQVEETFTGHTIVKVFGRQKEAIARFDEENEKLFSASFKAQFISGIIWPAMIFVGNLQYVAVAVVGDCARRPATSRWATCRHSSSTRSSSASPSPRPQVWPTCSSRRSRPASGCSNFSTRPSNPRTRRGRWCSSTSQAAWSSGTSRSAICPMCLSSKT